MRLKNRGNVFQRVYYEIDEDNAEAFVKNTFNCVYHPMGICAMGPRDRCGVVDERVLVHRTSNLRVVDASVFQL